MRSGLACGAPLARDAFVRLVRRAIFDCCKWHLQQGDDHVLMPFPLVLDASVWRELAGAAERLTHEAFAAERELLGRPDVHARLGLSRRLRRVLAAHPLVSGPRLARFDFHPTMDGWRITEGNLDVVGGLIEGSGVTALFAEACSPLRPAGDPAGALATALAGRDGSLVGLMHVTQFVEDRQIQLYLSKRLSERGARACLFDPTALRVREGRVEALSPGGPVALDTVFRFVPAHWFERLPSATRWPRAAVTVPFSNPLASVLAQSKRFPLVWTELSTPLPTWRAFLPETRAPDDVAWQPGEDWVVKPALGFEGDRVGVPGAVAAGRYAELVRAAASNPDAWVVQRCFRATPIETPVGLRYPCIGVFTLDGRAVGAYARIARRGIIDDGASECALLVKDA